MKFLSNFFYIFLLVTIWHVPLSMGSAKCISKKCRNEHSNQVKNNNQKKKNQKLTVLTNCQSHDEVTIVVSSDEFSAKAMQDLDSAKKQIPVLLDSCNNLKKSLQGTEQLTQFSAAAANMNLLKNKARVSSNTARISLQRAYTTIKNLIGSKNCILQISAVNADLNNKMNDLDKQSKQINTCSSAPKK